MILKLESKDGLWNPQQFKKISSMMEDSSCVVKILSDKSIALVVDSKDETGIKTELEKFGFNVSYDEESVDSLLKGSDEEPSCEKYENMDLPTNTSSETSQPDSTNEPSESLEDNQVQSTQVQDNIPEETTSTVQEETSTVPETTLEQPAKEGKVMDQNTEHLPIDDIGIKESNEGSKNATNINEVVISDQKVPDMLDENIVVNDLNSEPTNEEDIKISSAPETKTVLDSSSTPTPSVETQTEPVTEGEASQPVDTIETTPTMVEDSAPSLDATTTATPTTNPTVEETTPETEPVSTQSVESVEPSSSSPVTTDNQTVETSPIDESSAPDSVETSLTNELEVESTSPVLDETPSYEDSTTTTTTTTEATAVEPLSEEESGLESDFVTDLTSEESSEAVVDTPTPVLETPQDQNSPVDMGEEDVYEEINDQVVSNETINQPEENMYTEDSSTITGVGMNMEEDKLDSKIVSFEDSYKKEFSSSLSSTDSSDMLSDNVDIQTYAGNLSISIGTCVSITMDLKNQSEGMKTFSINGKEIYIEYSAKYCKVVCDGMQIRVPMSDLSLSQAC